MPCSLSLASGITTRCTFRASGSQPGTLRSTTAFLLILTSLIFQVLGNPEDRTDIPTLDNPDLLNNSGESPTPPPPPPPNPTVSESSGTEENDDFPFPPPPPPFANPEPNKNSILGPGLDDDLDIYTSPPPSGADSESSGTEGSASPPSIGARAKAGGSTRPTPPPTLPKPKNLQIPGKGGGTASGTLPPSVAAGAKAGGSSHLPPPPPPPKPKELQIPGKGGGTASGTLPPSVGARAKAGGSSRLPPPPPPPKPKNLQIPGKGGDGVSSSSSTSADDTQSSETESGVSPASSGGEPNKDGVSSSLSTSDDDTQSSGTSSGASPLSSGGEPNKDGSSRPTPAPRLPPPETSQITKPGGETAPAASPPSTGATGGETAPGVSPPSTGAEANLSDVDMYSSPPTSSKDTQSSETGGEAASGTSPPSTGAEAKSSAGEGRGPLEAGKPLTKVTISVQQHLLFNVPRYQRPLSPKPKEFENATFTKPKPNVPPSAPIQIIQPKPETKPATPTLPSQPAQPKTEEKPTAPTEPAQPAQPKPEAQPTAPTPPSQPAQPKSEEKPAVPAPLAQPVQPKPEEKPTTPTPPAQPAQPKTEEKPTTPTPPAQPAQPKTEEKPTNPTEPVPPPSGPAPATPEGAAASPPPSEAPTVTIEELDPSDEAKNHIKGCENLLPTLRNAQAQQEAELLSTLESTPKLQTPSGTSLKSADVAALVKDKTQQLRSSVASVFMDILSHKVEASKQFPEIPNATLLKLPVANLIAEHNGKADGLAKEMGDTFRRWSFTKHETLMVIVPWRLKADMFGVVYVEIKKVVKKELKIKVRSFSSVMARDSFFSPLLLHTLSEALKKKGLKVTIAHKKDFVAEAASGLTVNDPRLYNCMAAYQLVLGCRPDMSPEAEDHFRSIMAVELLKWTKEPHTS